MSTASEDYLEQQLFNNQSLTTPATKAFSTLRTKLHKTLQTPKQPNIKRLSDYELLVELTDVSTRFVPVYEAAIAKLNC